MTYTESVKKILDVLRDHRLSLNQIVRSTRLPRPKVITLLARLIRFRVVQWEYASRQFLFYL